jgi:hypothetical protein
MESHMPPGTNSLSSILKLRTEYKGRENIYNSCQNVELPPNSSHYGLPSVSRDSVTERRTTPGWPGCLKVVMFAR